MTHPTPWSLGEDAAGGRWITAADGFRVASVSAMADGDAELIVASVNAVAAAQAVLPSDERLASMIRSADASLRDPMTGRSPQRSGFYWRDMGHAVGVLLRTHVHNRAGKDEAAPEDGSQSLAAHGDRAGTAYTGPQDGPPMVDWFTAVLNMDGAQPAPAAPLGRERLARALCANSGLGTLSWDECDRQDAHRELADAIADAYEEDKP